MDLGGSYRGMEETLWGIFEACLHMEKVVVWGHVLLKVGRSYLLGDRGYGWEGRGGDEGVYLLPTGESGSLTLCRCDVLERDCGSLEV